MKHRKGMLSTLTAISLMLSLALVSCDRGRDAGDAPPTTREPTQGQAPPEAQKQRSDVEQRALPEIERRRSEAEQQVAKVLEREAIPAIEETEKALKAITENKHDEAMAAIERATGKISILLARYPATALLPVRAEVEIIDAAPRDANAIKDLAKGVEKAMKDKNYPAARVLLVGLMSEIRTRTYNLPLATYPIALREAARLLDQRQTKEAAVVLQTARSTLVVIDRVIPLPLVVAQVAINDAQALSDKDKDAAMKRLATARLELERAKELGYSGDDPEYAALNQAISDLEAQLKGKGDTTSAFAKLKERVEAFFKRLSEHERR